MQQKRTIWEFGEFQLDVAGRDLRRGGQVVALTPKSFELLVFLVQRQGDIVTKEEIFAGIWLDTIVEESNLSVQVSTLRRALGDQASHPVYIETIPRRGYRFLAPATLVELTSAPVPVPLPPPPKPRRWSALLGVGSLPFAALLAWYFLPPPTPISFDPRPLTSSPMIETSPALSPDGTQVLYVGILRDEKGVAVPEQTGLWLQTIGVGAPILLTKGFVHSPAWSPDGRQFSYIRAQPLTDQEDLTQLVEHSPFLGEDRILIDDMRYHGPRPGPGLSYSPDGQWVLTSMGTGYYPGSPPRRLVAVSRTTKEIREILPPVKGSAGDSNPVLSRDGRRLAFCRCSTAMVCDLYEVEVRDLKPEGKPRRLSHFASPEFRATRLPDDSLLYPLGPPDNRVFWRTSLDWMGRPVSRMISPLGQDVIQPTAARTSDGKIRLVYQRELGDPNIWRLDLDRPDGKPLTAIPLIVSSEKDTTAAYSPDGQQIAFASTRSGSWELWICDADGTNARQLTRMSRSFLTKPAWSADGQRLAFESRGASGLSSVLVVGANGDQPPRQVTAPDFSALAPAWSLDGKWLYFSSNLSGRFEVYRIPANQAGTSIVAPQAVTNTGATSPLLSPDSRFMTIMTPQLQFVLLDLVSQARVTARLPLVFPPVSGPYPLAYGIVREDRRWAIARFDWLTQTVTPLYFPTSFDRLSDLHRSPDGRHVLFTTSSRYDADLSIVDDLKY